MIRIALTPAQFSAKSAELLQKEGIEINGDAGVISKDGVKAQYSYNGKEIEIDILHHPFLISEKTAEADLQKWLSESSSPSASHQVQ